ncbi:MAG: CoA transferase, partial [Chloroflexi bacterium]|nr:CoA transferase [Chloroflexota bacterium]
RTAAYYLAVNRNKRSLRLDLSRDAGREVLRRLLREADVVVENFRVGGFERLGFSEAALAELNPALVHLAISGFGTTGPDAAKPGYDFIVQAAGGLMSITGEAGGRPLKVGVAISDVVTGLFGAVAVLAALVGRERGPGGGQRIDVSLLESTLAVLVNQAQTAIVTGAGPARRGNAHPSIVPYQTFATSDGEIAVGVGSERQWPRFCEAIGLPELATEARFATNGDRGENREALIPILAAQFAGAPSADWLARLDEAAIPCAPIRDVRQALDSAQAQALGSVVPVRHPVLGRVDQVAPPFHLAATPAMVRLPPPLAGEQADEILAEAGYDRAAIAELRRSGVV